MKFYLYTLKNASKVIVPEENIKGNICITLGEETVSSDEILGGVDITDVVKYCFENFSVLRRCNRCHSLVLKTPVDGYSYSCPVCDEDLYTIETSCLGTAPTTKEFEKLCIDVFFNKNEKERIK